MDALKRSEKNVLRVVQRGLREAAKAYHKEASKARGNGQRVEAAILNHLGKLLSTAPGSLDEALALLSKWKEEAVLHPLLPVLEWLRNLSRIERKAAKIRFIRSLELSTHEENWLIGKATQTAGRPPDGREVAVRALELHLKGQTWAQIERQLLPHRRDVRNPGSSIRRQVQFLKATLRRRGVPIERL
jgi:hypothetical protein